MVVVGGDLTQRARAAQFRRARAFLDALPAPWLAVPGNHDVPLYDLFRRVFFPLGRYHHFITRHRAPLFTAPGLRVLGLDSTRRKVTGRLKPDRVRQIQRLGEGDPDALRVLVTHHPLVRRPLEGAALALQAAEDARTDVLLAGHHHHAHITQGADPRHRGPEPEPPARARQGLLRRPRRRDHDHAELWTYDGRRIRTGQDADVRASPAALISAQTTLTATEGQAAAARPETTSASAPPRFIAW